MGVTWEMFRYLSLLYSLDISRRYDLRLLERSLREHEAVHRLPRLSISMEGFLIFSPDII